MNRIILALALVTFLSLTGCIPTSRAPGPVLPDKPPSSLADAAEQFSRVTITAGNQFREDNVVAWIEAANGTAKLARAGTFKDVTAADEFFTTTAKGLHEVAVARFKATSNEANKDLVAAMNLALKDEKNKPGADAAPMFDELAKGFSRANKKGK